MTLRIKIEHLEVDSEFALKVKQTAESISRIIRPGGFAEFWMHETQKLEITEVPKDYMKRPKKRETKKPPQVFGGQ